MEKITQKLLYSEIKKDLFRYVKFVFGGGLSLILNLIVTYLLTEFLMLWHMFSFTIALCVEFFFLFIYHSVVTFKKRGKFLIFALVIIFISALNWLFVYIFSVTFQIQYLISIVVVALIISVLNYLLN